MNLIHLSRAEYTTLSTTGTLTKAGVTYTFDPLNNEYIVPKDDSGGGVKMDLLWENASPTAQFAAQDVSVADSGSYKLYMIVAHKDNSNSEILSVFVNPEIAKRVSIIKTEVGGMGTETTEQERNCNFPQKGTIHFGDAYKYVTGASSVKLNNINIPYRIYGIK